MSASREQELETAIKAVLTRIKDAEDADALSGWSIINAIKPILKKALK